MNTAPQGDRGEIKLREVWAERYGKRNLGVLEAIIAAAREMMQATAVEVPEVPLHGLSLEFQMPDRNPYAPLPSELAVTVKVPDGRTWQRVVKIDPSLCSNSPARPERPDPYAFLYGPPE